MRFKDFKMTVYAVGISQADWEHYYKIRNLAAGGSLTDEAWLRVCRKNSRRSLFKVCMEHLPSGFKKTYVVNTVDRKDLSLRMAKAVNDIRGMRKMPEPEVKSFGGVPYQTVGGVFTEKGTVLKLTEHPDYNDPSKDKRPRSKHVNYIGVEIEFNNHAERSYRVSDIVEAFNVAKLGRYVHVGVDPSCGFEIRCLLPEHDWLNPLTNILALVKRMGFPCDERCGTHVHLDMRNRDIRKVFKNMFLTQTFLRKFLTKERKRNRYCLRNTKPEYDPQEQVRYLGINGQSYTKHGTIEIRMHHGTLDIGELGPWISLLLKIVNFNGEINNRVLTLKQARSIFNIEEPLTDVLTKRLNVLFKKKNQVPVQDDFHRRLFNLTQTISTNWFEIPNTPGGVPSAR